MRFKVPGGVVDGQVLRVKGQGHSGKYGGAPGDLLVKLQVRCAVLCRAVLRCGRAGGASDLFVGRMRLHGE